MERNLVWGSLGIGCLGWLCTFLLAQSRGGPSSPGVTIRRSFLGLAIALPFIVWTLTLPTSPPFSAGQGWGRGFLLGGLAALASALVIFRASSRVRSGVAHSSALFASLIVACVPLLWMRHAVIEVLVGAALGWIAVSLLLLLGTETDTKSDASGVSTLLLNGAAYATALFGVAALGIYRDFVITSVERGTYSAVAVALAATISLTLLFGAFVGEIGAGEQPVAVAKNAPLSTLIIVALTLIMPLGMGYLLAMKLIDDLGLIYVIATGLALGFALWWLAWDDAAKQPLPSVPTGGIPPAALLVALCAFMLSYQIMQGFGVGLMLLAAWPVSLLALPSSETEQGSALRHQVAQTLSLLFSFIAILLLSRLFATRFRSDLRGATLADQYALFGFLAGAVLPALLASQWFSPGQIAAKTSSERATNPVSASVSLARLLCIGILALALPSAMLALWGVKVVPAFFAGLGLAVAGFYPALFHRRQAATVALFALAIATTVTQWAHRFVPFAEVSRAARLHFLLWTMGSLILIILVVEYGARIALAMRRRNEAGSSPTQGAVR